MAKRILSLTTFTPTAFADTVNMTDATYFGVIKGGAATQVVNILEIYEGGQAGASSPTIMLLSRDSTVAGTVSLGAGQTDSYLSGYTSALSSTVITGNTASVKPQRDSANHLLNLSFNAFGGVVRWVAAPGEEISVIGQAVTTGEVSLSAFTGGTPGLMGGHIVYEPL